jgi:hypothetical protein
VCRSAHNAMLRLHRTSREHEVATTMLEHRPNVRSVCKHRPNSVFVEDTSWRKEARMGLHVYRRRLLEAGIVVDDFTSKVHYVWAWLGGHYAHLMRRAYLDGLRTRVAVPPRHVLYSMARAWRSAGY